jgi:5-methylcytosine-specific restriction protein B
MNVQQLADILVNMYENADGDKVAMIHLFGIMYASEIHQTGCNSNDIIQHTRLSDGTKMSEPYKTEIGKGIHLAKYVVDKKSVIDFINNRGN